MRALITGVAGFIGSTLADRLLDQGDKVRGIDCFTDYYDQSAKRSNVTKALQSENFTLIDDDLLSCDLNRLLTDVDVVFHQAGQPGVRLSWADGFETYTRLNIVATQRLLEAATSHPLKRLVYASSSSVYGAAERFPTLETDLPAPMSPYGVTKLAAEQLCSLYHHNFGVPTVSLRYFTVYGPRQRPDMAMCRLIDSAVNGAEFVMFGDGSQIRDFTYVDDIAEANILAASAPEAIGEVLNIGGGSAATMLDVVDAVTEAAGTPPNLTFGEKALGDVHQTGASVEKAMRILDWAPTVNVRDGVANQVQAAMSSK